MADRKAIDCPKCFGTRTGNEYLRISRDSPREVLWNKHYYISLSDFGTGLFTINTTATTQPGQSTGSTTASGTVTKYYGDNLTIASQMSPAPSSPPYYAVYKVSDDNRNWYNQLSITNLNSDKTIRVSSREQWTIQITGYDASTHQVYARLTRHSNSSSIDDDQTVSIEWVLACQTSSGTTSYTGTTTIPWAEGQLTKDFSVTISSFGNNVTRQDITLGVIETSEWWAVDTQAAYGYYGLNLTHCHYSSGANAGWYAWGSTQTSTIAADTDYAFTNTGGSTTTVSATVPGTASATAGYGYLRVQTSGCHVTNNGAGWYTAGSSVTTSFAADTDYAFNSSGTQTTTRSTTVPGTNTARCAYGYLRYNLTNATRLSSCDAPGWYDVDAELYVGSVCNSGYAFNSSGTTTDGPTYCSTPHTYSKAATHGYLTVSTDHCSRTGGEAAGWKALGSTYTTNFTADSGYAYNNSGLTTDSQTTGVPGTNYSSPGYARLSISAENCTATSNGAGWYTAGSSVTTTFTGQTDYAFDSSGTRTTTRTTTVPGTNSARCAYGYLRYNLTNATRLSSCDAPGWYDVDAELYVGSSCNSGYAFNSSGTTTDGPTYCSTPHTYTKAATHGYLSISTTNCYRSSGEAAGWKALGGSYTTYFTANSGYAYDSSGTTTSSSTHGVPNTNSSSPGYGSYTISYSNCAYSSGNGNGWYTLGTYPSTVVYANANYSFGGSSRDTTTVGGYVPYSTTVSPYYGYATFVGTHCTPQRSNGYYRAGAWLESEFVADSGWYFDDEYEETSDWSGGYPPCTITCSADYYWVPTYNITYPKYGGTGAGTHYGGATSYSKSSSAQTIDLGYSSGGAYRDSTWWCYIYVAVYINNVYKGFYTTSGQYGRTTSTRFNLGTYTIPANTTGPIRFEWALEAEEEGS